MSRVRTGRLSRSTGRVSHTATIAFRVRSAVTGGPANWAQSFASCNTFVDQLKKAGGDAEMMHLPALGIKGNSHMLMQDRNNLNLADLLLAWIDRNVERKLSRLK